MTRGGGYDLRDCGLTQRDQSKREGRAGIMADGDFAKTPTGMTKGAIKD
jgi:hypothetical protein